MGVPSPAMWCRSRWKRTAQITEAGPVFFVSAGQLLAASAADFKGWTRAIAEATSRKGAKLFMPLRSALTGATHGPELAPLVGLMGPHVSSAGSSRRACSPE